MRSYRSDSTDSSELSDENLHLSNYHDPLVKPRTLSSNRPMAPYKSSLASTVEDTWRQARGERRLVRSFSGACVRPLAISVLLLGFLYYLLFSSKRPVGYRNPFLHGTVKSSDPFVSGNYDGSLRPQIHFTPPRGFMNDPNGMFLDADGLYHLYYQYNPDSTWPGNQHWGHATSRDLYTWENQPIALYPPFPGAGMFSGSCVTDTDNTSGFFPNQTNGVVAMYTLHTSSEQKQQIAYSTDGGYTFTDYDANPVISIGSKFFRDPKVIWYAPTSSWVAVIAYPPEMAIGIYTSPDLRNWTHASNFTMHGLEGVYECPNLVAVPMLKDASIPEPFNPTNFDLDQDLYVMIVSINPGSPLGGSTTQYFPGTFNGTHFKVVDGTTRLSDFGKDNYASHFFYGIPSTSAQISIAWASNWQYAADVPTGDQEGFRSVMSLPRFHALANATGRPYTLLSYPIGLNALHTTAEPIASSSNLLGSSLTSKYGHVVPSRAIYFSLNTTGIPREGGLGLATFTVSSSTTGESVAGGFYLTSEPTFWIDRDDTRGFKHQLFTQKFIGSTVTDKKSHTIRVLGVIDRSIMELFADNGVKVATVVFYPEGQLDTLEISMTEVDANLPKTAVARVEVWGLNTSWDDTSWERGVAAISEHRSIR